MTPAERLRAAADLIERTGTAATPGPWIADGAGVYLTDDRGSFVADTCGSHPAQDAKADAAWIALVGPDLAPALAAWLRGTAASHRPDGNPGKDPWGCTMCYPHDSDWPCDVVDDAVAFADLILRAQSPA